MWMEPRHGGQAQPHGTAGAGTIPRAGTVPGAGGPMLTVVGTTRARRCEARQKNPRSEKLQIIQALSAQTLREQRCVL